MNGAANTAANRANRIANRVLTVAITLITASAIAIAPSVQPAAAPAHQTAPTVQLAAQVAPLASPTDPLALVIDWAQRIVIPPSASAPFPTPQFLPTVAPTSVGSSIKNIYNAVEPWVRYGFDLAAYAVGWVPYVGWLAPQITIFYNFGERIARSITYNFADFLDGRVTLAQGLINVGIDTFNSFVLLGIDQLHFWLPSLPPLPPLPPFPFSARATSSTVTQQLPTARTTVAVVVPGPNDPPASALIPKTTPTGKDPKSFHPNNEVNETTIVATPTNNTPNHEISAPKDTKNDVIKNVNKDVTKDLNKQVKKNANKDDKKK